MFLGSKHLEKRFIRFWSCVYRSTQDQSTVGSLIIQLLLFKTFSKICLLFTRWVNSLDAVPKRKILILLNITIAFGQFGTKLFRLAIFKFFRPNIKQCYRTQQWFCVRIWDTLILILSFLIKQIDNFLGGDLTDTLSKKERKALFYSLVYIVLQSVAEMRMPQWFFFKI